MSIDDLSAEERSVLAALRRADPRAAERLAARSADSQKRIVAHINDPIGSGVIESGTAGPSEDQAAPVGTASVADIGGLSPEGSSVLAALRAGESDAMERLLALDADAQMRVMDLFARFGKPEAVVTDPLRPGSTKPGRGGRPRNADRRRRMPRKLALALIGLALVGAGYVVYNLYGDAIIDNLGRFTGGEGPAPTSTVLDDPIVADSPPVTSVSGSDPTGGESSTTVPVGNDEDEVAAISDGGEHTATDPESVSTSVTVATTATTVDQSTDDDTGSATQVPGTGLRPVNLVLPPTSFLGYGYWLAVRLGYYEEEGLDVNLWRAGGSSDVVQILANGQADVGMTAPGAVLAAIEAGAGLYPFFTYAYGPAFDFVVPAGSVITAIADLSAKRIGVPEPVGDWEPLVRALLAEAGLDQDSDVVIVGVTPDAEAVKAAFDSGRIDAYASSRSDSAAVRAAGLDTVSVLPSWLSALAADGLVATEATKGDDNLLAGLGRATAKGQLVAYSNPEGALCVLKDFVSEEFTADEAGRAGLTAAIDMTTAPTDGGRYVFGFVDTAGWNSHMDLAVVGGALSQEFGMTGYLIDQLLEDINDFDRQAIIDQAANLPTDCYPYTPSPTSTTTTPPTTTSTLVEDPLEGKFIAVVVSAESESGATRALNDLERDYGLAFSILLSSDYRSLRPGYWVVYLGPFNTPEESQDACWTALNKRSGNLCYGRRLSQDISDVNIVYPPAPY